MSSIVVFLCSVLAMMAEAVPETCSRLGGSCEAAPEVAGVSLLQYRMEQAPDKAPADAAKEVAKEAEEKKEEAPTDAKDAPKEEAKDAGTKDAGVPDAGTNNAAPAATENADNATGNATGNVSTNVTNASNATTPAPSGCVTKNDPRASAWFAETSPDGTPCVFAADVRDEGSHCILSDGEYGSNGWCWTSIGQSTWGSCGDNCPLYGPAAKLGSKIDGVAKVVKDIHGMLNESAPATNASASENTPAAANEAGASNAAPAGDAKAEEAGKKEEAPAGDAPAAPEGDAKKESSFSQMHNSLAQAPAPPAPTALLASDEVAKKAAFAAKVSLMKASLQAKKVADEAKRVAEEAHRVEEETDAMAKAAAEEAKAVLLKTSFEQVQAKQDPKKEAAADAKKEPAADAKAEPEADAKKEPAADAKKEPAADAKAEPAVNATPEEAPAEVNASNATNVSNVSNATVTEAPSSGCVTKEDPRVAAWFTETASPGTPCVFGVDARDEGGHCIFSGGQYGSNGWCFTAKDKSAWGSCTGDCPLYGAHKKIGDKIEAVTDMVAKVSKHIEAQMNGTTNATAPEEPAADANAPAADANAADANAPAADAKDAAPAADAKKEPAADTKAAA